MKAEHNPYPYLTVEEAAAPATPAAGRQRLFVDTADRLLKLVDDAGTVTPVGAAALTAASQAEMEAGTEAALRTMSPLRVAQAIAALGGGGGGSARYWLDQSTLHATYGDDFETSTLAAKWTRHVVTAGEETHQAADGSFLQLDLSNAAAVRGYRQAVPAGDFEIVLSYVQHVAAVGTMFGPFIVSTVGTGVMCTFYHSALNAFLGTMTTWAYGASQAILYSDVKDWDAGRALWLGLRKVGTNYSFRYSRDGRVWTPYSANHSNATTMAYIGFGRILGTPATHRVSVDRFNVI